MKFEGNITSPAAAPAEAGETGQMCQFTLEQGELAGQTFTARLRICLNPCCPCGVVGFECDRQGVPSKPLAFDLDVFEREVNTTVQSAPAGVVLARAFLAEAQPLQWEWLAGLFYSVKRDLMKTMDLDKLQVDLPPDVKNSDGTMVGYGEIFPWAELFRFTHEGAEWVVDDQYCISPGCDCTSVSLAFFRTPAGEHHCDSEPPPREPLKIQTRLHFDYCTGKFQVDEVDEPKPDRPTAPAPGSLIAALRAAQSDLVDRLRHRHGQLQQLGRRLMPKPPRRRRRRPLDFLWGDGPAADEPPPPPPASLVRASPKVGRNDPCPCGSGKKFKRCCGAA